MRLSSLICLAIIAAPCVALAGPVVIDHTSVENVKTMLQATLDAVAADLNFFFAHASVGDNMMSGLTSLNASRYKLTRVTEDGTPPASTVNGKVYDYARGNPAWQTKVDDFKTYMQNGWAGKVDIVMNKFCYIDPAVTLQYYAVSNANGSAMSQLEAAYPAAHFVYMTIPLTTDNGADNISRNNFNDSLRAWVIANNKLLFDIADIEAHDAAGNDYTFNSGGHTYQRLNDNFSSDGGHLSAAGQQQVALGFYAVGAAVLSAVKAPGDANGDGKVDIADLAIMAGNWNMPSGATWAMGDFSSDSKIDISDLSILAGNWHFGMIGDQPLDAASAPEPATLALLAVGGLAILRRRRRRLPHAE